MDFHFFETVKFYRAGPYPTNVEHLEKWLGPSKDVVSSLCYKILKSNGETINCSTVRPLTLEERGMESEREKIRIFEKELEEALGAYIDNTARLLRDGELPANDEAPEDEINWHDVPEHAQDDHEEAPSERLEQEIVEDDSLVTAEVLFPRGDGTQHVGKVIERKRGPDGNLKGRRHDNPILDTREYVIRYPDGSEDTMTYSKVVEHLYSQVDEDGNQLHIYSGIVGQRKRQGGVHKADQFYQRNGREYKKRTTAGWDLEVEWKDGSTSWVPLKVLKKDNPLDVAKYAVDNQVAEEPAFDWWVHEVLRRLKRLVSKARKNQKRHFTRVGYKYGIEMPRDYNHALELDKKNGNDLWQKALEKERSKVKVAMKFLKDGERPPPGYKKITGHWVFDIKMDLTRKARFVAGGHLTDPPQEVTYSSVVSRDTVRIMLTIAALHDLDVRFFDIDNAYLNAETDEKVYFVAGQEFGPDLANRDVVIVMALYGLKSAGASFHRHLAGGMRDMGFTPCLADPDTWMRAAVKPCGFKYYEYVTTWVDDGMIISNMPEKIIKVLEATYVLQGIKGLDAKDALYLGSSVGVYDVARAVGESDEEELYPYASAEAYISKVIPVVEEFYELGKYSYKILLPKDYHPEMDESKLLNEEGVSLYQSYMGILRWCVELGRIDIIFAAAQMAQYQALLREGHLMALGQVFAYLKKHQRSRLVFGPTQPDFSGKDFKQVDWSEFYLDVKEAIPPNAPEPRGKGVSLNLFVDASHAANVVTRRSHTGFIIFIGRAPVVWYSKRQNTVESAAFGAEFVALKQATEANRALRYKLRMLGIPVDRETNVFSDNQSVCINSSVPESTLKKKHNSLAYHAVRWAAAAGELRVCFEKGKDNLADLLTKNLEKVKHQRFSSCIMW